MVLTIPDYGQLEMIRKKNSKRDEVELFNIGPTRYASVKLGTRGTIHILNKVAYIAFPNLQVKSV